MKKSRLFPFLWFFLCPLSFIIYTTGYASNEGFYLGVGVGKSAFNYKADGLLDNVNAGLRNYGIADNLTTISGSVDNSQFAGRFFLGYEFNPYLALETGVTYNTSLSYSRISALPSGNIQNATAKTRQYAVDVLVKPMIPLYYGFTLFAKAGFTYEAANTRVSFNSFSDKASYIEHDNNEYVIAPTYGIGLSYNITPYVVTDISWMRVNGHRQIPSSTMIALSFSYHFVSPKCGEFLC